MSGAHARPSAKALGASEPDQLDRDLPGLSPDQRWRVWMHRVEAVLFASAAPVERETLARVVSESVSVDLLIADLGEALAERPYEIVRVGTGWMFRTRPAFADVLQATQSHRRSGPALNETEMAVLCAVAYHQPIDRAGLADIFGKEIARDVLTRLRLADLIALGPRAPRRGAPQTFVTTDTFLAAFDLESLRDLPDLQIEAPSIT